jgi:iron complex outermembrane receptor protein
MSGGVSLFLNRTFGTIDKRTFQSGPNEGQEQRINLDGSRIYGVEVTGATRPVDRLTLDGHLTWMQPRAFQDGNVQKLDEKPAWLGTLTATYDLPLGLAATVQAEYTDGAFARNEQNAFVPLPSAFVLDGRVSYRFAGPSGALTTEVYARVNNATDALRLLQLGLPGPGRSFQMGAKIAF